MPIDQLDLLVSKTNCSLAQSVNGVTLNDQNTPYFIYTKQGPLIKIINLNLTYPVIKAQSQKICLLLSDIRCKPVEYAIFHTSGNGCCNKGVFGP
jgi:hypothetical protein